MPVRRRALFGAIAGLGLAPVAATAATERPQTLQALIEELQDGLSHLIRPYLFETATPTLLADLESGIKRHLSTKRLADYTCVCDVRPSGHVFADIMFRQPGRDWIYMPVRIG